MVGIMKLILEDPMVNDLLAFAKTNPSVAEVVDHDLYKEICKHTSLEIFDNSSELLVLGQMLALAPSLQSITIYNPTFSIPTALFARELAKSKSLNTVKLSILSFESTAENPGNPIFASGFARELVKLESLHTVQFSRCVLDKFFIPTLTVLAELQSLRTINLYNIMDNMDNGEMPYKLGPKAHEGILEVARELVKFKSLDTVNFGNSNLSNVAIELSKILVSSTSIAKIGMVACSLGDCGLDVAKVFFESGKSYNVNMGNNFRRYPEIKAKISEMAIDHKATNPNHDEFNDLVQAFIPVNPLVELIGDYVALSEVVIEL